MLIQKGETIEIKEKLERRTDEEWLKPGSKEVDQGQKWATRLMFSVTATNYSCVFLIISVEAAAPLAHEAETMRHIPQMKTSSYTRGVPRLSCDGIAVGRALEYLLHRLFLLMCPRALMKRVTIVEREVHTLAYYWMTP
jgi:hypothetical protein